MRRAKTSPTAAPAPAPVQATPAVPAFVYVASKLPSALQLSSAAGAVVINGVPLQRPPDRPGEPPAYPGGYAITKVPREIWDGWLAANFASDVVLNDLVHGEPDYDRCVAYCFQHVRVRSGVGQVRMGNPVAQAGKK